MSTAKEQKNTLFFTVENNAIIDQSNTCIAYSI